MGHGHSGGAVPALEVSRWSRIVVLGLIAVSGVAALLGVLHWWPDSHRTDHLRGLIPFAANGYTLVHAQMIDVVPICTGAKTTSQAPCGSAKARILDGKSDGRTVSIGLNPDIVGTGLEPGDRVLLFDGSAAAPRNAGTSSSAFSFYRADRGQSMLWLAILFAAAVVLVAWRRGLMALISLGFAGLVVVGYLIPALLSGQPAVPVTLASSALILIVMLYLTHGPSMRTSVALAGALVGIAVSTLFAWVGITGTRLAGVGNDAASLLSTNVSWIDVQQLVVASVILAGLGTLNDVTVTQASALWELRGASPHIGQWELFRRAMRIGRDHVASTVYTLVFAYLGTSLLLLVAVQLYGGGLSDFVTAEDVAEEIVRTLVGGIALVLAMPITTAIGTLVAATAALPVAHPGHIEPAPRYLRRPAQPLEGALQSSDIYRRLTDTPRHGD